MHVYVRGYPHDVGGAGQHLWSVCRLWRSARIDVTLLPMSRPNDRWLQRLNGIGAITRTERHLEDLDELRGQIVVGFCSEKFLRLAPALREMDCRLVWVGCMSFVHGTERQHYASHGPFDRVVTNSSFQDGTIRPELLQHGYRDEHVVRIPSPFWADEWDYRPRPLAAQDDMIVGRLSRHDPDKYAGDTWSILERARKRQKGRLRARMMAWNERVEAKLGQPPIWAECLKERTESAAEFLGSLHALCHKNGGAQENRPRVCFEAMAAGVPVVAENAHGWPELVRDDETGYLCDSPAEFAERLDSLRDPARRERITAAARQAVSRELIDRPAIAAAWQDLFAGLEPDRPRPPALAVGAAREISQEINAGLNAAPSKPALPDPRPSRFVAGLMAIGPSKRAGVNPSWRRCLASLAAHCDTVHVRLDCHAMPAEQWRPIYEILPDVLTGKLGEVVLGRERWNAWNWREDLLRSLDRVSPSLVLFPDADEEFALDFERDLERLRASDRTALQFAYQMATEDNAEVPVYPRHRHMKAFKWRTGLSYAGYRGYAAVTQYASSRYHLAAIGDIVHYCYYTEALRSARRCTLPATP